MCMRCPHHQPAVAPHVVYALLCGMDLQPSWTPPARCLCVTERTYVRAGLGVCHFVLTYVTEITTCGWSHAFSAVRVCHYVRTGSLLAACAAAACVRARNLSCLSVRALRTDTCSKCTWGNIGLDVLAVHHRNVDTSPFVIICVPCVAYVRNVAYLRYWAITCSRNSWVASSNVNLHAMSDET
jgi:hypothetical protein